MSAIEPVGMTVVALVGITCIMVSLYMMRLQRRDERNDSRFRRLSNDSLYHRPLSGTISAVAEEENV